ncbi:hypothetical protein WDU94_004385 [Cyamophila willieti]
MTVREYSWTGSCFHPAVCVAVTLLLRNKLVLCRVDKITICEQIDLCYFVHPVLKTNKFRLPHHASVAPRSEAASIIYLPIYLTPS